MDQPFIRSTPDGLEIVNLRDEPWSCLISNLSPMSSLPAPPLPSSSRRRSSRSHRSRSTGTAAGSNAAASSRRYAPYVSHAANVNVPRSSTRYGPGHGHGHVHGQALHSSYEDDLATGRVTVSAIQQQQLIDGQLRQQHQQEQQQQAQITLTDAQVADMSGVGRRVRPRTSTTGPPSYLDTVNVNAAANPTRTTTSYPPCATSTGGTTSHPSTTMTTTTIAPGIPMVEGTTEIIHNPLSHVLFESAPAPRPGLGSAPIISNPPTAPTDIHSLASTIRDLNNEEQRAHHLFLSELAQSHSHTPAAALHSYLPSIQTITNSSDPHHLPHDSFLNYIISNPLPPETIHAIPSHHTRAQQHHHHHSLPTTAQTSVLQLPAAEASPTQVHVHHHHQPSQPTDDTLLLQAYQQMLDRDREVLFNRYFQIPSSTTANTTMATPTTATTTTAALVPPPVSQPPTTVATTAPTIAGTAGVTSIALPSNTVIVPSNSTGINTTTTTSTAVPPPRTSTTTLPTVSTTSATVPSVWPSLSSIIANDPMLQDQLLLHMASTSNNSNSNHNTGSTVGSVGGSSSLPTLLQHGRLLNTTTITTPPSGIVAARGETVGVPIANEWTTAATTTTTPGSALNGSRVAGIAGIAGIDATSLMAAADGLSLGSIGSIAAAAAGVEVGGPFSPFFMTSPITISPNRTSAMGTRSFPYNPVVVTSEERDRERNRIRRSSRRDSDVTATTGGDISSGSGSSIEISSEEDEEGTYRTNTTSTITGPVAAVAAATTANTNSNDANSNSNDDGDDNTNTTTATTSTRLTAITAMRVYRDKSFEELRMEDYGMGNRGIAHLNNDDDEDSIDEDVEDSECSEVSSEEDEGGDILSQEEDIQVHGDSGTSSTDTPTMASQTFQSKQQRKRKSKSKNLQSSKKQSSKKYKMKKKKKKMDKSPPKDHNCVVCLSEKKTMLLQPCNHMCVCAECVQALHTCPICRCDIHCSTPVFW